MIEVVGIGADGWAGLAPAGRGLVLDAEVLLGGARQLALVPAVEGQERRAWPTPLRANLPGLLERYAGRRLAALASGDPLVAGIGVTLVELLGAGAVRIHPAVSSVALARARMGWDAATVDIVRIVSPTATELRARLAPGRRIVALSRDGGSPAAVASLLVEAGFGFSVVTVFGDLGSPEESRREAEAAAGVVDPPALNLVCVACVADREVESYSSVPGLPDDAYEHDGQISKRVVRAAALAHLRPARGQLLWDLGAGAGSVSVEWCRAAADARAIAVERDPDRAARIDRNAARLGVTGIQTVSGVNADALTWLPRPDAVFVGGGATAELLRAALDMLTPLGRLVAHAVTVETEALLLDLHARLGGEVNRISVDYLNPIGRFRGWEPARPVVQWSLVKGADPTSRTRA